MTDQVGDYLIGEFNKQGGKPADYTDEVFGQVQKLSPLTIWINQDLQISGNFIELTTEAKGLTIDVSIPIDGEKNKFAKGKIDVFKPLVVGDRVRMLRVQRGQRFVVLGRA